MKKNYQTIIDRHVLNAALKRVYNGSQTRLAAAVAQLQAAAPADSFLATARGLSRPNISRLTNGEQREQGTMLATAHLLAQALEIPVETLIISTSEKEPLPVVDNNSARDLGHLADFPYIEIPYTSIPARASFAASFQESSAYGEEESVRLYLPMQHDLTFFKDKKARVFEVDGDSMDPKLVSGDKVVAYLIAQERWETLANGIFVVSYADTLTIKMIRENTLYEKKILTLYPWRTDMEPMRIRLEHIHCIYQVDRFFSRATDKITL